MIVSYLGTKGGTGTTTMAVNGAADIRRITNRSTVIVDLKHGPGDVALFLGLRPRHTVLTALDKLAWIDPLLLYGTGEKRMKVWTHVGIASNGVLLPESRFMITNTGIASSANCGIERASVARKMPSDVTENK